MATVFAAETREPPMAMLVPGLLLEGCLTASRTSPVLTPETLKLCSLHVCEPTDAGVIAAVNFSSCIPPVWVVLTRARLVERLSRYWSTPPVFQTSPGAGALGSEPEGMFRDALDGVDAAKVCGAINVLAAPS